MKPSILVVMLDFLVCSLLLFVIGTGGQQTQFATSAPPVHAEFSAAALQAQQEEWNRNYEQETLVTKLQAATAEKEQLRTRLTETSTTLAAREQNLRTLTQEKARVERARAQTEQALAGVESQLAHVSTERTRLQQEGAAAKEQLAKLETEQTRLAQEKQQLSQHAEQLGQTVSSQQATIGALAEEVRASQARAEAQLTDLARGQQELGTNLAQLNELTRNLPAALQQSVAGVHQDQQALQQNVAALAGALKDLPGGMNAEDRARLLQGMTDVARGQQALEAQLDTLIKSGQGEKIASSLDTIEAGQEALRTQASRLGEQIESIKSHGHGPFQAVKGARIELATEIRGRDPREQTTTRFKARAFPPVVRVDGHSYIITGHQTFGVTWLADELAFNPQLEVTSLQVTIRRSGDTNAPVGLAAAVCALRDDPRVVAVELTQPLAGLTTMELATPAAVLQSDQRKLQVFKSTAAGLSFEVEIAPDLSDPRYAVIKRSLRGIATWFENPAYRADTGDYVVTADGKLVGLMVSREKCFLLSKENLTNCVLTLPLTDRQQFARLLRQYPRVR